MGTIVYKYGLLRPTVNAELVQEQMKAANRYYNRLIEIERARRVSVRLIMARRDESIAPQIAASMEVRTALAESIAELKQQRARTRSRSETEELRARIAALRERAKEVFAAEKAARAKTTLDELSKFSLYVVKKVAQRAVRNARENCGVFWGTYLQIEAAVDAARKMPLWSHGELNDPRFRAWRGEGAVAVQIQHGIDAGRVLGCEDTRLQIEVIAPSNDWQNRTSKRSKNRRYATLRMRVGSDGRAPIWAEWPMVMHRPLPDGSLIMWAKVKRTMIADHDRWSLHLTLRMPDGQTREKCGPGGVVAVNFGWRELQTGGRRVAYWSDEDGNEDEIREEPSVLSGLRKVEDLASIRDKALDELRGALCGWMSERELPDWMREASAHMHAWKAPRRFAELCRNWTLERWTGDEMGYALLEAWYHRDRHLWQWQEHQRAKSLGRRKDQYRNVAAQLARRYGVLVIENFDLRDTQRHNEPEGEAEAKAPRLQQKDAACSELRTAMAQAFEGRGGRVQKVDAYLNTQRCTLCGCEDPWDAAPQVDHTCSKCGETWDQDANNCKNILRRYRENCERPNGAEEQPVKRLTKWARLGRHNGTARV